MSRAGITTLALGVAALSVLVVVRLSDSKSPGAKREGKGGPTAVELAPVARAAIERRQVLSGTIEARARFVVAANASGRVERLLVDLADPVVQGQSVPASWTRKLRAGFNSAKVLHSGHTLDAQRTRRNPSSVKRTSGSATRTRPLASILGPEPKVSLKIAQPAQC